MSRSLQFHTITILMLLLAFGCSEKDSNYSHETLTNEADMYKSYSVSYLSEPLVINADWDKPAWQGIEPLTLELYMGQKPSHKPKTQVKLAWDNDHIYVIFRVEDQYVRAVATEYFGNVWQDSCVEFFFTPQAEVSKGYFNLETNCIGTILLNHQRHRGQDRISLDTKDLDKIQIATSLPKGKPIETEITEPTVWTLEYALPWRMLKKYIEVAEPEPGTVWRANFYKCADKTSHPHWLTWSEIPLDKPDFHQPEYFGYLKFAE